MVDKLYETVDSHYVKCSHHTAENDTMVEGYLNNLYHLIDEGKTFTDPPFITQLNQLLEILPENYYDETC